MLLRLKFLFKFFLFSLILVILFGLAGLFFFLSRSSDTIAHFVPKEYLVYFHFSFDPFHLGGYRASKFFQKNWPNKAIDSFFPQNPAWRALKINFSPEFISYLEEFGLVFYQQENEIIPFFVYRFKPGFANLPLVLAGPDGSRLYTKWLSQTTVLLGPKEINSLEKTMRDGFLSSVSSRSFVGQNFAEIYFNWDNFRNFVERRINDDLIKNLLLESPFQHRLDYFEARLKGENIIVGNYQEKKPRFSHFQEEKEVIKEIFFKPSGEYFLFYNQDSVGSLFAQKLRERFIWPKFFEKNFPQIFIFTPDGFVFITEKPANFFPENIERDLSNGLSYFFPQEKKVLLPDGTEVIELIAEPSLFVYEKQDFAGYRIVEIKKNDEELDLGLAYDNKVLFFVQGLKNLKPILKTFQQKSPDMFIKNCWRKNAEENLVYIQENSGLNMVINSNFPSNNQLVEACFNLK